MQLFTRFATQVLLFEACFEPNTNPVTSQGLVHVQKAQRTCVVRDGGLLMVTEANPSRLCTCGAVQRVLLGADICNSGDGRVTVPLAVIELQCTFLRLCLSQAEKNENDRATAAHGWSHLCTLITPSNACTCSSISGDQLAFSNPGFECGTHHTMNGGSATAQAPTAHN